MKKDLTRAECFALSITQWCVKEVSGDTSTPVFFTEITSSSKPSLSKHKKYFNLAQGKKYKFIYLEAKFTSLTEKIYDRKGNFLFRPYITGEFLFRNIGASWGSGRSIVWDIYAMNVQIDIPNKKDPHVICYDISKDMEIDSVSSRNETIRFKSFFGKLFDHSINDKYSVVYSL